MKCPYCGSEVLIKDTSFVYHKKKTLKKTKGEKVWVCSKFPQCDSYVRCFKGTDIPMGRVSNARLRTLKIEAHKQFDSIWKSNLTSRENAYIWLANKLGIEVYECHIGMFDIKQCQEVIRLCRGLDNELINKYRNGLEN